MSTAASGWHLEWVENAAVTATQKQRVPITSTRELAEVGGRLDERAAATRPLIAELVAPSGASLGIGLGQPWSVLSFKSGPVNPPYYQSVHLDAQARRDEDVEFFYQGEWTEFPSSALIAKDAAQAALCEFFETSKLPVGVEWEEV